MAMLLTTTADAPEVAAQVEHDRCAVWLARVSEALASSSGRRALAAGASVTEDFAQAEPELFRGLEHAAQASAEPNATRVQLALLFDAGAQCLTDQLAATRPGVVASDVLELWIDALREAYVSTDITPQDRVRSRAALAAFRQYAGLEV